MKIGTRLRNRRRKILLTLSWDTQRKKNTANLSQGTTLFVTLEEATWLIDNTTSSLWDLGLQDAGSGWSGTNFKKRPQIHDESKAKKTLFFQIAAKKIPLLSTNTTPKYKIPPFIYSEVMSMVTRPPMKNGHKRASGHVTVCNSHSWPGYLTISLCENDCQGIANPCLDCYLSRE